MDNQLVQRYQNIQSTISKIETEKLKAQTELDLKEKELTRVADQLKELGVTDLSKAEDNVKEAEQSFIKALNEAEEMLANVSRT